MSTRVGAILPVCEAAHTLESKVAEILDALPITAARFELTLVDDGSMDETADVAQSLAARFPQVRVVGHPTRLGLAETVQTGLDNADGGIILMGNGAYQFDPRDLSTLWRLRDLEREAARSTARPASGGGLEGIWQQLGFQVISRATFEQYRLAQAVEAIARIDAKSRESRTTPSVRPKFLGRIRNFSWGE